MRAPGGPLRAGREASGSERLSAAPASLPRLSRPHLGHLAGVSCDLPGDSSLSRECPGPRAVKASGGDSHQAWTLGTAPAQECRATDARPERGGLQAVRPPRHAGPALCPWSPAPAPGSARCSLALPAWRKRRRPAARLRRAFAQAQRDGTRAGTWAREGLQDLGRGGRRLCWREQLSHTRGAGATAGTGGPVPSSPIKESLATPAGHTSHGRACLICPSHVHGQA